MNQDVPDSLTGLMPDFANHCYKPGLLRAARNPGLTLEDLVPWSTGMGTILSGINISTQSGLLANLQQYLPSLFGGTPVTNCKALYDGMQADVSGFLGGEATQQGSTKQVQYQTVLQMTANQQAQFFVHRELQKHLTPAVNDPNRVVNYRRAVDAASFATGAIGGFDLAAWGKSTAGQVEKQLDRISRFLGMASFLVHWAPYIVGFGIFATLSFFPIVLIWSLFPGQHFKPLVNYFLLLVFHVLDAAVVGDGQRGGEPGAQQFFAGRGVVRGDSRLGNCESGLRHRVGRRDRHGADRPGDPAVRHLASHRRDLAWVNQAWLRS